MDTFPVYLTTNNDDDDKDTGLSCNRFFHDPPKLLSCIKPAKVSKDRPESITFRILNGRVGCSIRGCLFTISLDEFPPEINTLTKIKETGLYCFLKSTFTNQIIRNVDGNEEYGIKGFLRDDFYYYLENLFQDKQEQLDLFHHLKESDGGFGSKVTYFPPLGGCRISSLYCFFWATFVRKLFCGYGFGLALGTWFDELYTKFLEHHKLGNGNATFVSHRTSDRYGIYNSIHDFLTTNGHVIPNSPFYGSESFSYYYPPLSPLTNIVETFEFSCDHFLFPNMLYAVDLFLLTEKFASDID